MRFFGLKRGGGDQRCEGGEDKLVEGVSENFGAGGVLWPGILFLVLSSLDFISQCACLVRRHHEGSKIGGG